MALTDDQIRERYLADPNNLRLLLLANNWAYNAIPGSMLRRAYNARLGLFANIDAVDFSGLDDIGKINAYLTSKNALGISKVDNPFSKMNIKGTTKQGAFALTSAASPFITKAISGGYNAGGVGNGISSIGSSVGSAVGMVNPLAGAIITGASAIIGGGVNRMFGLKKTSAYDRMKKGINAARDFRSTASSFDNIVEAPNMGTMGDPWKKSKAGVGFAKRKRNEKNRAMQQEFAQVKSFADRSVVNNANLLKHNQMNNMLANYADLGGPLMTLSPDTAIGFKLAMDSMYNNLTKARGGGNIFNPIFPKLNAFGGNIETHGSNFSSGLTHVDVGGTHEENPYLGVQMGADNQGTPNLVEEGEVILRAKGGDMDDYVFSNRLKVPDKELDFYSSKVLKPFKGKEYSKAAKSMEKQSGILERPNDPIAERTLLANLGVLVLSLEQQRFEDQLRQLLEQIQNMSPEEFAMLLQEMQQGQQQEEELAMLQQQDPYAQQQYMYPQEQGYPSEEDMYAQYEQQPYGEDMAYQQPDMSMVLNPQMMAACGGRLRAAGGPLWLPNLYPWGGILSKERMLEMGYKEDEAEMLAKANPLQQLAMLVSGGRGAKRLSIDEIPTEALQKAYQYYEDNKNSNIDADKQSIYSWDRIVRKNPDLDLRLSTLLANRQVLNDKNTPISINTENFDKEGEAEDIVEPVTTNSVTYRNNPDVDIDTYNTLPTYNGEVPEFKNYINAQDLLVVNNNRIVNENTENNNKTSNVEETPDWKPKMDVLNMVAKTLSGDNDEMFKTWNGRSSSLALALKNWKKFKNPDGSNMFESKKDAAKVFLDAYSWYNGLEKDREKRMRQYNESLKITKDDLSNLNLELLDKVADWAFGADPKDSSKRLYSSSIYPTKEAKIDAIMNSLTKLGSNKEKNNILLLLKQFATPDFSKLTALSPNWDKDTNNYDVTSKMTGWENWGWGGNNTQFVPNLNGTHALIKGNWVNPNTGKIDAKVGDVTKSFDNMNSYERDFYNYWYPRYIMTKDLYDAEQAWIKSGKDIKDFNYDNFFNTNDNWKKYIAANLEAWKTDKGRFRLDLLYRGYTDKLGDALQSPEAFHNLILSMGAIGHVKDALGNVVMENGKVKTPGSEWWDWNSGNWHNYATLVDDNAGVRNAYYYDGPNGRTFYRYDSSPEFIDNLKKYFTIGNAETSTDDRGYITNLYKLTPNGIRFREVNEPHDAAWENLADYKNVEGEGEGTPPFPMLPTMPFMAGIGANMLGLAYNIMNPLDYSDFNAYRAMAEKSGNYKGVQATPRPGYLAYRPIDREWENRLILALANATNRQLANLSGRNFGTASAGIANNAANMYRAMGDQMIKSEMANRTHEGEVFKVNDAVNQGNSELLLKAAIADSEAYANAARTNAELLKGAYDYKYKIEKDRGDAISAGISGLASNLYNNALALYNNDLIRWGFKSGAVGAKGGPIRRKRRGLNF